MSDKLNQEFTNNEIADKWAQHLQKAIESIVREEFEAALDQAKIEAEKNIERRKRELLSRVVVAMSKTFSVENYRNEIVVKVKIEDLREES